MKLTLYRGIPGSGKSTLAKQNHIIVYEADQYFLRPDGTYSFDVKLLKNAHEWCFSGTCIMLNAGFNVAVANTFTTSKEMQNYIDFAKENGHKVEIITLTENYGNIHNVPEEILEKMKARFVSHDDILKHFDLVEENVII